MPRPHTEFIQSQTIPWEQLPDSSPRAGAMRRLLSRDPASGATSNVLRCPPGWHYDGAHRLGCAEEFFVLDGNLVINGVAYGRGDYAYLPAGFERSDMSSAGAEAIVYWEGQLELAAADATQPSDTAIECLQSDALAWSSPTDSSLSVEQVGLKILRQAANGDRTWLLKIDLLDGRPFEINGVETHPTVEETYLISGDMAMPMGQMQEGAYFWRPPYVRHGPMGTATGFLGLFRCKEGGAFATEWSAADQAIDWDAPYRPILPP